MPDPKYPNKLIAFERYNLAQYDKRWLMEVWKWLENQKNTRSLPIRLKREIPLCYKQTLFGFCRNNAIE